mgnify:CR=1 FL=1
MRAIEVVGESSMKPLFEVNGFVIDLSAIMAIECRLAPSMHIPSIDGPEPPPQKIEYKVFCGSQIFVFDQPMGHKVWEAWRKAYKRPWYRRIWD